MRYYLKGPTSSGQAQVESGRFARSPVFFLLSKRSFSHSLRGLLRASLCHWQCQPLNPRKVLHPDWTQMIGRTSSPGIGMAIWPFGPIYPMCQDPSLERCPGRIRVSDCVCPARVFGRGWLQGSHMLHGFGSQCRDVHTVLARSGNSLLHEVPGSKRWRFWPRPGHSQSSLLLRPRSRRQHRLANSQRLLKLLGSGC